MEDAIAGSGESIAAGAGRRPPNLRHLRVFLAVSQLGTITAAAEALHLSQPAATQGLHKLEREFGAALFLRTKTGAFPTEAGAALLARLQRGFQNLEEAARDLARAPAAPKSRRAQILAQITTAQLEALVAIVQHGSFALAARASGLAQPTLHRAARDLERIVDTALFEQTSFGVKPTRAAEDFARRARLFFHEIDQGAAEIAALSGREAGASVVGAMPLARSHIAPKAVSDFMKENQGHRVSILEGPYEALLAGLRRGEIDFLIGALRENLPARDVVQEHLFDDPLSIIMRAGHPLARARALDKKPLTDYPWVAPRRDSPLYSHFEDLFAEEPPRDCVECNSMSAARVLLANSDRLMLLSEAQARYEIETGALVSRPHPGGGAMRPIGLTFRKDWRATQTQQRLLDRIRKEAKAAEARR